MEELKAIIKLISIVIAVTFYAAVWVSVKINWEKCMKTGYAYSCPEKALGNFYKLWIGAHVSALAVGICLAIVWAWL